MIDIYGLAVVHLSKTAFGERRVRRRAALANPNQATQRRTALSVAACPQGAGLPSRACARTDIAPDGLEMGKRHKADLQKVRA